MDHSAARDTMVKALLWSTNNKNVLYACLDKGQAMPLM